MQVTKFSDQDIFEIAYRYSNSSDAYSDLGSALVKKFPNDKNSKIYLNNKVSDYAYNAIDNLIRDKTGVTLSKIQKYNDFMWLDNKMSDKNVYYNHFFPSSKPSSKPSKKQSKKQSKKRSKKRSKKQSKHRSSKRH
jgi:hypothetical protein